MVWLFGAGRPARRVRPGADARLLPAAAQAWAQSLENGFVVYNDEKEQFEKLKDVPLDPPLFPRAIPSAVKHGDGTEYIYFTAPYPALRVKADWRSYLDLASYEGYTCLKPGTRYGGKDQARLDRDADGKLVWAWKKDTPPLNPKDQQDLVAAGKMTARGVAVPAPGRRRRQADPAATTARASGMTTARGTS